MNVNNRTIEVIYEADEGLSFGDGDHEMLDNSDDYSGGAESKEWKRLKESYGFVDDKTSVIAKDGTETILEYIEADDFYADDE